MDRAPTIFSGENPDESARQHVADLLKVHKMPRSSWALDLEGGSEIAVPAVQGIQEHEVDGKPNGATPVRIAAKKASGRVGWLVSNRIGICSKSQFKWLVFVLPRERANSVRTLELLWV